MMNMFCQFEFSIPQKLANLSLSNKTNNPYLKDFLNGFFATLMATPCSAPFVGTAITAAFTQTYTIGISIFLFMGVGMSLPYLIIASFGTQLNGDSRWNSFYLETTTNNGGAWDQSSVTNQAISQGQSDNNYGWHAMQYVADIDNISNDKVRFKFRCSNSSTIVTGGGNENFGSVTFIRIGS